MFYIPPPARLVLFGGHFLFEVLREFLNRHRSEVLTTMFAPKEALSGWLETAATFNPMTYVLQGLRSLSLEGWDASDLGFASYCLVMVAPLFCRSKNRLFRERGDLATPDDEPVELDPLTDAQIERIESICAPLATAGGGAGGGP